VEDNPTSNAFNGGGRGHIYGCCGTSGAGGGGGASDIRIGGTGLNDRVVVAGGGGGAGGSSTSSSSSYRGGRGGGLTGEQGFGTLPGGGGTQTAGGGGLNGSFGQGADGGQWSWTEGGGGGGGGWYGGGGGRRAGGGGGSSYTASNVTNVSHTQGFQSGNGQIIITWQAVSCASQKAPIPIVVTNTNTPPSVTGNNYIVCGQTTTLTATGSGNALHWYTAATGGSPVNTTATYITPNLLGNDTFYVETLDVFPGGLEICQTARTPYSIVVNDTVLPPVITGSTVFCGFSDTLVASGSSGHFRWYNQAVGGSAFSTADSIVTPELTNNAVYYVEATSVANAPYCVSQRVAVQVTVTPVPDPIVPSDTVICGNSATLTAGGSSGIYNWFTQPSGGSPFVANDTSATVTPLTTTTYYVQAASTVPPYSGNTTYSSPGTYTIPFLPVSFSIDVDVRGASGGSGYSQGGNGGRVTAKLPVTPGQQIQVNVGSPKPWTHSIWMWVLVDNVCRF
jgi:hypothetical protein